MNNYVIQFRYKLKIFINSSENKNNDARRQEQQNSNYVRVRNLSNTVSAVSV